MTGRKPPWSDPPQELLSAIANFLTLNPISMAIFNSPIPPFFHLSYLSQSLYPLIPITIIYAVHGPLQSSGIELSSLSPHAWILFVDEFTLGSSSKVISPVKEMFYSELVDWLHEGLRRWKEHLLRQHLLRLVRIGRVEFAIAIMLDKVYEKLKTLIERYGDYPVSSGLCVLKAATRVLNLKKTVVRYHQEEESVQLVWAARNMESWDD